MNNILIIDDERVIRDSISFYLSDLGHETTTAENGEEGIELLKSNPYDIVFVDLRMPKMSGIEFLKQALAINPNLPIIIVSGANDIHMVVESMTSGACDYLAKPIANMEILDITMKKAQDKMRLIELEQKYTESLESEVQRRTGELKTAYDRLSQSYTDLKVAKQKAEQANQFMSTFLQNISHEIRTPIYGIVSFADLIQENKCTQDDKQNYLKIIKRSGIRMLNLLSDIIEISKITAGIIVLTEKETPLQKLLEDMCNDFKFDANRKLISVEIKEAEFPDSIIIDAAKLEHTVSNIIDNAIKFTKKGKVTVEYKQLSHTFQISVADTGIGIPEDKYETIFEEFRQISDKPSEYEGTGLGLSICRSFVEAMNGRIWPEANESGGTTFFIELPLKLSNTREATELKKKKVAQDHTILVTDDDENILLLVETILENEGFNLITASNGKEAVDAVENNPSIDLVIMDIKMPIMDGIKATKIIHKSHPKLPIIGHTAFAPELDIDDMTKIGFTKVISKPIKSSDMIAVLQKHL